MRLITEKPSEKEIYIWNILGSLANAGLSVIILMVVTRTLDNQKADIFSIAWAISQLMATIGCYQIRVLQATDVEEKFTFRQYFEFRIVTIVAMMICSCAYVYIKHYTVYKAIIIIIICGYRAVDSLADVFEGWFQQKERLDLAGRALFIRVIIAIVGGGICLVVMHDLLALSLMLLFIYVVGLLLYDIRYYNKLKVLEKQKENQNNKWLQGLLVAGTPLFVNAYLLMDIMNTPKIVIDAAIMNGGLQNGSQTIFNILFMPASVLTLAYIVFRPLLTKMAIEWTMGRIKNFLKIIGSIMCCLLGMSILIIGGSALLGIPVLSVLYAMDLTMYKKELLLIILGGCFCTFSYVLDNALVVIRRQYLLVCAYVVSWAYVKIFAHTFVGKWGIMGAAIVYTTSMLLFLATTLLIFIICLKKEKNHE
ncbi:Polysaccharide biosynthesis protein [uncultured Ruminococcus sp.]|nr:Polysaccharide biosynthesis protein [uncultured Ruminococcus sp.]